MSINVNDKNLGHATAYAYYKAGGGTMTEAEFTEFMADFGTASQTAVEAAQAALASKNAAQTAATTATNKASEATTAATTATTKAGEASTSASTATSAKDTAVSASQTATTKATEATTAAATAVSAKDDAVSANTAAQSAKTAAQTAQAGAETAAASVSASAAQIQTNADDISELKEDFTQMESDGVVPSAEQILTDKGVTDSVPYHYRKTGGDGSDRLYDQIVGGSLAVNQLAKPVTSDYWSAENNVSVAFTDSVATFTSQTKNNGIKSNAQKHVAAGHVYYMGFSFQSESASIITFLYGGNGGARVSFTSETSMTGVYKIAKADASASGRIIYLFPAESGVNVEHKVKNVMLIDLTQMFGTTIADYVYGLETATAGAGVAWLKARFPRIFNAGYVPYNAGTLEHVSGLSAHKMTGFNQWDEEWELASIDWSTRMFTPAVNGGRLSSKNYIPVLPNTTYYINRYNENYIVGYDSDNPTNGYVINNVAGRFTTPSNCHFIKFGLLTDNYGKTYKNDICINISDPAKNGTYEPYKAHSYPLDSDVTLRGLFKLDANNKLYADGDTYEYTGKVTRNTILRAYQSGDESLANAITDGTNTVVYSANASTEQADPYQHLQQCDPDGTEEYVSTGIVPIGHNSFYPENLRAKVEQLPWNFANLIAPTESTFTATRNYTTGALFIVQNVLYKATSNIANGGMITPNTNCTATTLAEIISALA